MNILSICDGSYCNLLLEPSDIIVNDDTLQLCIDCSRALFKHKLPKFALANKMYLGAIPPILEQLTKIEETMIFLYQPKSWIIQMQEENPNVKVPRKQTGMWGHSIIYLQDPVEVAKVLPPSVEDIVMPMYI